MVENIFNEVINEENWPYKLPTITNFFVVVVKAERYNYIDSEGEMWFIQYH